MKTNQQLFKDIIRAISLVIDFNEKSKHNHSQRVALLAIYFADQLNIKKIGPLFYAGLLHDIGDLGSTDPTLQPNWLGQEKEVVGHIEKSIEILTPFKLLHSSLSLIANHHERFDGAGFPEGKVGEDMDLESQVLQAADILDCTQSGDPKSYIRKALRTLHQQRGRAIHPQIADAAEIFFRSRPDLIESFFSEEGLLSQITRVQAAPPNLDQFNKDQILGQLLCLLAQIIDTKHMHTLGHSIRVSFYSSQIAEALGDMQIDSREVMWAGLLHDVGIVRVPSEILAKSGPINEEERIMLEDHTRGTEEIISTITYLSHLAFGTASHHEHYAGTGYQNRIAAEEIPLIGRILAYAEMYDTLTTDRSNFQALSSSKAIEQMRQMTGTLLDPHLATTAFDVFYFFGRHPLHFEESVLTFQKMVRKGASSIDGFLRTQRRLGTMDPGKNPPSPPLRNDPWQNLTLSGESGAILRGVTQFRDMVGQRKGRNFSQYFDHDCQQKIDRMLLNMKVDETRTEQVTTLTGTYFEVLIHRKKKTFQVFYRKAAFQVQSIDKLALFYRNYFKSSEAVIFTDHDGKIVDANQRFLDLHGLKLETLIGRDLSIVKSGDHPPSFYRNLWQTITDAKKGFWSGEIVNRRLDDDQKVFLYLTIHSLRDPSGQILGFIGHGVDITAQKRVSEALQDKKLELEASNHQLKHLTNQKSDLMAITSHDLKVPLNAMIQTAYLAKEALAHQGQYSREQALEQIERIMSAGKQMARFIQDVLDAEKFESGSVRLQKRAVQLDHLLEGCVEDLQILASPQIQLKLNVEVKHGPVFIDPIRMRQVFDNLLSNAIKFSPKDGSVTITYGENTQGQIQISVADQGPGISENEIDTIFDRFVQGHSRVTGSGLGLFIVKQILQHHGGDVKVHNHKQGHRKSSGAVFTATIPMAAVPGVTATALILGREKDLAPYLEKPLRQKSVRVFWARDEKTAQSLCKTHQPNIIFFQNGLLSAQFMNTLAKCCNATEQQPGLVLLKNEGEVMHRCGAQKCLTFPILESEVFQVLKNFAKAKTSLTPAQETVGAP